MAASHPSRALVDMTLREYHIRREAERHVEREALRTRCLEAIREAVACLVPVYPKIEAAHLFGLVLQPGRFGSPR